MSWPLEKASIGSFRSFMLVLQVTCLCADLIFKRSARLVKMRSAATVTPWAHAGAWGGPHLHPVARIVQPREKTAKITTYYAGMVDTAEILSCLNQRTKSTA